MASAAVIRNLFYGSCVRVAVLLPLCYDSCDAAALLQSLNKCGVIRVQVVKSKFYQFFTYCYVVLNQEFNKNYCMSTL